MEIINVPALGLTAIKTDGPPQLGNESTELQELHDSPGVILASPNENKKKNHKGFADLPSKKCQRCCRRIYQILQH
jgi:hypothetical protein